MELVEDDTGMFPGETCLIPVCSKCKNRIPFEQAFFLLQASQATIEIYKMDTCLFCGHVFKRLEVMHNGFNK